MQSAFSTAQRALSGVMADLETLAMFAMAGSLKSEHVSDSFTEHRELILRSAQMLVKHHKRQQQQQQQHSQWSSQPHGQQR